MSDKLNAETLRALAVLGPVPDEIQREIRFSFNNAIGGLMNGDSGWIIHTPGHADDLMTAAAAILAMAEERRLTKAALADPNSVHVNMLRGEIAMPSVAQIIHLYGATALRKALGKDQAS